MAGAPPFPPRASAGLTRPMRQPQPSSPPPTREYPLARPPRRPRATFPTWPSPPPRPSPPPPTTSSLLLLPPPPSLASSTPPGQPILSPPSATLLPPPLRASTNHCHPSATHHHLPSSRIIPPCAYPPRPGLRVPPPPLCAALQLTRILVSDAFAGSARRSDRSPVLAPLRARRQPLFHPPIRRSPQPRRRSAPPPTYPNTHRRPRRELRP